LNCSLDAEDADATGSVESLQFDFGTIRVATDDFSEANKLEQGGFGSVYRVWIHNYINMRKTINYESN
jgi:hypothetical protein